MHELRGRNYSLLAPLKTVVPVVSNSEKGNEHMKRIAHTKSTRVVRMLYLAMTLLAIATAAGGCRTAHGFGEDMERAGEKIQDKTDK